MILETLANLESFPTEGTEPETPVKEGEKVLGVMTRKLQGLYALLYRQEKAFERKTEAFEAFFSIISAGGIEEGKKSKNVTKMKEWSSDISRDLGQIVLLKQLFNQEIAEHFVSEDINEGMVFSPRAGWTVVLETKGDCDPELRSILEDLQLQTQKPSSPAPLRSPFRQRRHEA